MNKHLKHFLIFISVLLCLWIIGRVTNAFQYYNAPSAANEPGIGLGEHFFASNLIKPERFDFVCYKADLPMMGWNTVVHRLCGLPGDTIEIRNGDLFVNGKFADGNLSLMFPYKLHLDEFNRIKEDITINDEDFIHYTPDSVELFLTTSFIKEKAVKANRKILPNGKGDGISEIFPGENNQDHFGPVIVPEGKYFFLGDNRQGSQDSRYLGFIDKKYYVATVLWK